MCTVSPVRRRTVRDGAAAKIEADGLRVGDQLLAWGSAVDPEPLITLAKADGSGLELLSAPTISVFPRQLANITIANETSYISDYDASCEGESIICDPIVSIVQSGLTMEARAQPTPDRSAVMLELDVRQSQLREPMLRLLDDVGRQLAEVGEAIEQARGSMVEAEILIAAGLIEETVEEG